MFKTHDELEKENLSQPMQAETVIGPMVKVEGDFVGHGNVIVSGEVVGNISTDRSLSIEEGAKVKADVSANDIKISGEVDGKVEAKERIELTSTAVVKGNILAKVLVVNPGAVFNGQCNMTGEQKNEVKNDVKNIDQSLNSGKKKKEDEA